MMMLVCDDKLSYAYVVDYCAFLCSIAQGLSVDNILGLHISVSIQNYNMFTWDLLFPNFLISKFRQIFFCYPIYSI
jgi:hypothetical protein